MEIYGCGILGVCMFVGFFIGKLLAAALGLSGDVGGVGFAMVLMIALCAFLEKKGKSLHPKTEGGIQFVSAMYIPVVVAMTMNQDVYSAISHGLVPIAAGAVATLASLAIIPVLSKLGTGDDDSSKKKGGQ